MRGRIAFLVASMFVFTGCQMDQFSMRMNKDHTIPFLEMNSLPVQTEPDLPFDDEPI